MGDAFANYPAAHSLLHCWRSGALFSLDQWIHFPTRRGGPALRVRRVQSHDMLYKMSRDILYTLRAGSSSTERAGMPWKTMDAEEQKVRFVVAAARREKSLTALCVEVEPLSNTISSRFVVMALHVTIPMS
jgi:hypothetical protein